MEFEWKEKWKMVRKFVIHISLELEVTAKPKNAFETLSVASLPAKITSKI